MADTNKNKTDKAQPIAPASDTERRIDDMTNTTADEQLVSGDPTPAAVTRTMTKTKVADPPEATVEAHQEASADDAEYQEDPNTRQETIAWEYKGNGYAWLDGIPARDLTNGEYRRLSAEDKARIRKSDLYEKPPQVEKHVRDTARKGTPPKTSKEVAATKRDILSRHPVRPAADDRRTEPDAAPADDATRTDDETRTNEPAANTTDETRTNEPAANLANDTSTERPADGEIVLNPAPALTRAVNEGEKREGSE